MRAASSEPASRRASPRRHKRHRLVALRQPQDPERAPQLGRPRPGSEADDPSDRHGRAHSERGAAEPCADRVTTEPHRCPRTQRGASEPRRAATGRAEPEALDDAAARFRLLELD
jgi:hypothetical protein